MHMIRWVKIYIYICVYTQTYYLYIKNFQISKRCFNPKIYTLFVLKFKQMKYSTMMHTFREYIRVFGCSIGAGLGSIGFRSFGSLKFDLIQIF